MSYWSKLPFDEKLFGTLRTYTSLNRIQIERIVRQFVSHIYRLNTKYVGNIVTDDVINRRDEFFYELAQIISNSTKPQQFSKTEFTFYSDGIEDIHLYRKKICSYSFVHDNCKYRFYMKKKRPVIDEVGNIVSDSVITWKISRSFNSWSKDDPEEDSGNETEDEIYMQCCNKESFDKIFLNLQSRIDKISNEHAKSSFSRLQLR